MRKFKVFIFFILFVCFSIIAFAASKKEVPPWMEDIDATGRSNYLIPKGAKRKIVGSQVIVEPPSEYVARRFYELEEYLETRFSHIEDNQKYLKEELESLRVTIEDIQTYPEVMQDVTRLNEIVTDLESRLKALEVPDEPAKEEDQSSIGVIGEGFVGVEGSALEPIQK